MTSQQIYEWLKRHEGKLCYSWYERGIGYVTAPEGCVDESQWVVIGGRA